MPRGSWISFAIWHDFALPLIEALDELPGRRVWKDGSRRLARLARQRAAASGGVLAVLAEFEPMGEVGPVTLEEVAEVLSERLRFLRPRSAGAAVWARVRRLHRRSARARISRGVPAGAGGGVVSAARVRRSAAARRCPQGTERRLAAARMIATHRGAADVCSWPWRRRANASSRRIRAWMSPRRGRACRRSTRWNCRGRLKAALPELQGVRGRERATPRRRD